MISSPLLGRWRNTDPETRGILAIQITALADSACIQFSADIRSENGRVAWPSTTCQVYACTEEDQTPGAAALGCIEVPAMQVEVQIRINKGILCVMTWTRFHQNDRSNAVVRELFYRDTTDPLLGTWKNTDARSRGLHRVIVSGEIAPTIEMWMASASPQSTAEIALGHTPIQRYQARDRAEVVAFSAQLDDILLQGNLNRGLMVLATYRRRLHGVSRFSREFFARHSLAGDDVPISDQKADLFATDEIAVTSLNRFVGTWQNTDPTHAEIRTLSMLAHDRGLEVNVDGAGRQRPAAWPANTCEVYAYRDESGQHTQLILARFSWEDGGHSDLQIKHTQGMLVVACFHQQISRNWFVREFFHRSL